MQGLDYADFMIALKLSDQQWYINSRYPRLARKGNMRRKVSSLTK